MDDKKEDVEGDDREISAAVSRSSSCGGGGGGMIDTCPGSGGGGMGLFMRIHRWATWL